MTYLYKCPHCKKETTITKAMMDSDRVEHCEICENELKRVYESPSVKTSDGVKR